MIIDTDMLIWFFRGNGQAKAAIEKAVPFHISAVTYMELMQGARDKSEQMRIKKQLSEWRADVIHIESAVSFRAVQYVTEFSRSHSVTMADALIAATVIEKSEILFTANTKHFRCIPGMTLKTFRA